ncbi:general substrate transporter [Ascobolus immersus RN42]|uniref:General substrate transporter n=1 Tax=Ascobolus immersus RN42 TaxID=1160509 RepID=A0A3N4ILC7_ASCIM|nr:general substrate transporter [Ascobolus immersus RN42]
MVKFLGIRKPDNVPGSAGPAIVIGIFVAFGGILFGYDTGSINGILGMDYFQKEFATEFQDNGEWKLSSGQTSLVVSILSLGTFFGALTAAPTADVLGRRLGLVASCAIFSVGVALQTAATAIPLFAAGRAIAGFGVGIVSAIVPLYQSESAPKWIRGTIVGAYQLAITIGLLLAACVNQATHEMPTKASYRIPVALQFLWAAILAGGMLALPETPRYLIKKDRYEDALKSLGKLRKLDPNHESVKAELDEIKANYEHELSIAGGTGYADLFKGRNRYRLFVGCGIQVLQQLTGVNFIFYYGTTFFKSTGIKNPFLIGLTTNLVNVVSTVPGMYLVERIGRRQLLLMGAAGMFICQYIVAIVGVTTESDVANKVLIAFVCFYIFFFASSWGPVGWVYTGELYSLKTRAKSLSISTAANWLLNFAIGYATPYLVDEGKGNANLGAKVFFVWGSCCAVCFIFVWFFVYETKGHSLEAIDEMFEESNLKAWNSSKFVSRRVGQDEIEHVDVTEKKNHSEA